jgi:carboxymethylenebutenolidase
MTETEITVRAGAHDMPVFVAHPDTGAPFPVVVMLMDGGGIREGLRENARSLAAQGYFVMLPNLFHRSAGTGPIGDLFDMDRITELNTGLKTADVVDDVVACARRAAQDANARGADHLGLIGYCMGGRLAVTVAQALGDRVAAVASLHPGYMATRSEASPHLFLDNIKARVYFGLAETDPHLSPGQVSRLKAALDENGVDYRLEIIPGTEHGYAVPGRDTYCADGARKAEAEALALFRARL